MAFPNGSFPGDPGGPPIQSLLNLGLTRTSFRLAPGMLPIQATPNFGELDRRAIDAELARTLEVTRAMDPARAMEIEADHRLRLLSMLNSRARGDFGPMGDLMGAGADEFYEGGSYRERGRDRDRDQRDSRNRDSDRDRGRDRDKRRDHDRDRRDWGSDQDSGSRRHGRDRSSNRDRSPMRSSRSDDRDQGYDYDDDRGGSDRHRGRDSEARESRSDGDKWVSAQPSRTIILRGLNLDVDSKMISAELMILGLPVKDIRLIRRSSGVSRGFAFVEFHNADDAKRWMDHTQGTLILQNQYRAYMDYSISKERQNSRESNIQRNDWVCVKCMAHNFKRRDYCYNCNLPRKESEKGKTPDGQDEVGTNPCNTLIFRGLDALTTEEGLVTALNQALPSTLAPIKNIAIIRDDLSTSRGFGFVEFHSVAASTQMLEALNKSDPLEVDGKQLLINYAKNTYNTTMATIQQQQSSQYYDNYYQQQGGQYYDSATQQYYDYSQYYNQGSATTSSGSTSGTSSKGENSTNAAAAVAQAAIQQAQAVKNYQKQVQSSVIGKPAKETVTVNGVEYPVYPPPDTSSYQYDETSGYYYDPLTQLYYDANSQYYYNSVTGGYMYWDAEKSTYLPAPTNAGEDVAGGDDKNKKDGRDKKDKEKVKIAKKIAKDMEKWAKSMNAQKEALKDGGKRPLAGPMATIPQESAAADAGFAILTKSKEDKSLMPPPPMMTIEKDKPAPPGGGKPGLVASYGGDSDSGEEEDSTVAVDESKLVDWNKLTCLLCKRKFLSKEILSKHTQFSDLHKENLDKLIASKGASGSEKVEYRDRAKERRQKYGAPEPPEPKKRKDRDFDGAPEQAAPVPFAEPTKHGIGGDNIGNKMLQKMGWSHGQGLGKSNQGRTDPIEAQRRNESAGLGARGGKVVADVGDSYRDALKKTMYARYNEME